MDPRKVVSRISSPMGSPDFFSFDLFNARQYPQYGSLRTHFPRDGSLRAQGGQKDDGLSGFLSLTRVF